MQKLFILFNVVVLISCTTTTKKDNDKTVDHSPTTTVPVKTLTPAPPRDNVDVEGCYRGVLARDTFAASLHQKGNSITGKLSFDNFEKDGSSGSVTGKLQAAILQLYYNFASEGMNSIMEVYFKYSDHKLVCGIGEMGNRNDTAYFINPAAIQYTGSVLTKLACAELAKKYK